ncbi:MAG: hypothetical protein E7672_07930 [Ruminococcaceae bacterium]|nr:hypothetical protein [Oscillospiraceae bacterium]
MNCPKFSGGVILNIDFNSVTFPFLERATEEENFSRETLYPFVDQYLGTHVKALAFNTFCQCSATPSKVWSDYEDLYNRKIENGIAVDYTEDYKGLYRCYKVHGVDPFEVWIDRCREKGLEAWLSLRMNDCHEPRAETFFARSDFFYEAKEKGWMNGILPGHGLHYHYTYNYAVPEVRKKMLDYIEEQLDMYDVDALELDFSRELICFKYMECDDKVEIMNDFIRNVKKIVTSAEEKHSHRIKIAVRLARDIDQCKIFGFDADTWNEECLVDCIIPTPRYFTCDTDMPINVWKERCKNIEIGAGIEMNFCVQNNKSDISAASRNKAKITSDVANGMAAAYVCEGADVAYLYNFFLNPYTDPSDSRTKNIFDMINRVGKDETIFSTRRRQIIMYQEREITPFGIEPYHPLPLEIARGDSASLSVPVGFVPSDKKVRIILGFSHSDPNFKDAPNDIELKINGKPCRDLVVCDEETLDSLRSYHGDSYVSRDVTLYSCDIPAESLSRYTAEFNAKRDVVVEYMEIDIQ